MADNPPEHELDPIIRIAWGLIVQLYCARDDQTDLDVEITAERVEAAGTSHGWTVTQHERTGPCPEYPNRRHVVVAA